MSVKARFGLAVAATAAVLACAAPAGAVTWTPVGSGTGNEITGIEYQSDSRFWFVTSGGEIFKREGDGSFSRKLNLPGVPFSRIAFQPGGNVGIAASSVGDVYRSGNGGDSWTQVTGLTGMNDNCNATEAIKTVNAVRFAGDDVVYLFAGGNKILRSPALTPSGAIGATGNWSDVNAKTGGGCRADFPDVAGSGGVSDGFFIPGNPDRGWMMNSKFGEMWFTTNARDLNNSFQKQPVSIPVNGFSTPHRLTVDPGQPNRQWGIAVAEGGNTSYVGRTIDGWSSEADWVFPGTRPERRAQYDIAFGGGTVVNVGDGGQIEMSPDGTNFYFTPAGGDNSTRDWRSVDVSDSSHAAVGGVSGTLAVSSDANVAPDLVKPTGTIVVPPRVDAGVPATFTVQANEPINPASVSWRSFSSGVPTQAGPTVSYTFPRDGIYTLAVTFNDLAGNAGEARAQITVTKPEVNFLPPGAKSPIPKPTSETRNGTRYTVLKIRGTLGVPPGIAKSVGCKGTITATVTNKRRLVTARKLTVSSRTCKYGRKVRFRRSKIRGRIITVTLEWPGNTVMSRKTYKKTFKLKK